MPIYDLGYRPWQGRLVPETGRFWAITETGVRLAWRSRLLRRLLLMGALPTLYIALLFFAFERVKLALGTEGRFTDLSTMSGPRGMLRELLPAVPNEWVGRLEKLDRHPWWLLFLWVFFRFTQSVVLLLIVGLVAPPLIAHDVRTRAFLLYFSRPMTRIEYILGKMVTVCGYLLFVTTLPALALYALGVILSPDLSVLRDTWDLPLRILGASVVLMLPTAALALALSSLTSESRFATFAWFAVCAVGWVTYAMLHALIPGSATAKHWTAVSLFHTLGEVQGWVIGLEPSFAKVSTAAIELAAITVISLIILFRRVSSPMRI